MDLLTNLVAWLNAAANAIGGVLLAPVGALPGTLSATLVAIVSGVVLLLAFKYTSNQKAIKRVRADIKANLLALKLFKESARVALDAQGRILAGAFWLAVYAIVPILVMAVPVLLLITQLALWYQHRPLYGGEDAVVTLKLGGSIEAPWPNVRLEPTDALEVKTGPVRIQSKREICWDVLASQPGYHRLVFRVDGQTYDKEFAVGDSFMRVSTLRPGKALKDVAENPAEKPFGPDSPVQGIEIAYPKRASWTSGTDKWVYYWFIVSFVAAFCFKGVFKVNI
ncbi:MAG TPA: hypothetical protein VKE94_17820 [Gemmataceae bacterium]|nr:hypothetical protein [Gemmataceae bacterium]